MKLKTAFPAEEIVQLPVLLFYFFCLVVVPVPVFTSGRFRPALISGVFAYCRPCLRRCLNIDRESIDGFHLINSRWGERLHLLCGRSISNRLLASDRLRIHQAAGALDEPISDLKLNRPKSWLSLTLGLHFPHFRVDGDLMGHLTPDGL